METEEVEAPNEGGEGWRSSDDDDADDDGPGSGCPRISLDAASVEVGRSATLATWTKVRSPLRRRKSSTLTSSQRSETL